jgi:hypothetical protein
MELLDRYLQAVKKHLPWQRQDDIIAELRANLESQLEDKESALGRPLTTAEAEDWLRSLGAPMMVASRYQPQQYLIGPALFPIYWYNLRMALVWAAIIYAIVSAVVVPLTTPNAESVFEAALRIPFVLFNVAIWVTMIFVIFEFVAARYPQKCPPIARLTLAWNPSSLPPLEKHPDAGVGKPRSFAHSVAEVVFGFLFLPWLLLIPHYPFLLIGPGIFYMKTSPFHIAGVWWTCYWWVVGLTVIQLLWRTINLIRGAWQRRSRAELIVERTLGLIPLSILLNVQGYQYMLLRNPAKDQAQYGTALDAINKSIHLGLMVLCAITILQLAWGIGQYALAFYRRREMAR